jgi:hypothetical protein
MSATFDGYVHARDARLVDGHGRPVLLRGVGLGNWLLPEGYMWRFGPGGESAREIEALTERLLGAEQAAQFWKGFRDGFITEADIAEIAASGYDHVRLPINSRIIQDQDGEPIESGYALIDRLIGWCRTHRLWVLLDLHGAPGGQTGTNIDDSPRGLPELFMSDQYRALTVRLWKDLATRYRSETVVLGYDLLNEPIPNEWQHTYGDELAALYRELTRVVREVDPDHLLMYEGSHWATNWSIFTEVWDSNSCLQFHKYWSSPDTESISTFLEARDRLGLPIYMGEGGENTLEWIYSAFRMYEAHDIGWNLWPWKKMETTTSPVSIIAPDGWERVIASISDTKAISAKEAKRVFTDFLQAIRLENSNLVPAVSAAALGTQPAIIPAWGYGYRGQGQSYGVRGGHPIPGVRADDAVSIAWRNPGNNPSNPFEQSDGRPYRPAEELVVHLEPGDWLEYELSEHHQTLRVIDATGQDATVEVSPSARGLRVTATAPTALLQLRPFEASSGGAA